MERGEAAVRLTRTAALHQGFPADVPDTPENRKLLAMIEADIAAMPDDVMPDVPYDYSADEDGSDTVVKAASDPGDPNPVEADHVYNQLLANYPPKAIEWVKDARWIGPVAVDPDRVDTQDEDSWAASHQPARVKHFVKNLDKGKPVKPGVCVQEPGQQTVKVIDGHHRFLAARKADKPYMAYVGFVDQDGGPWDEAHSSQFHSGTDPKNKSAQTAELSILHKPLGTHGLWGDKAAQLPAYIQNIAHALQRDGHAESEAIQIAIGTVKRWAAGGGKVTPEVQAAAAGALAEWEKLKAEHNKTKSVVTPDASKVGPHGYVHGWIKEGETGILRHGDYTMDYHAPTEDNLHQHMLIVHHSDAKDSNLYGDSDNFHHYVGHMKWDADGRNEGRINEINIEPAHRRQGLADALFGEATARDPKLHHSPYITEDGNQFVASLSGKIAVPETVKVGPHGYIHGWIFVGVPGMDDEVRHPEHGKGTITAHDGKHVTVAFKNGKIHTFAVHRSETEQGHFTKRGDLEHELGHKLDEPQEPHSSELSKKLLAGELKPENLTDDDLQEARQGLLDHHMKVGLWTDDEDHIDGLRRAVQQEISERSYTAMMKKITLTQHAELHAEPGAKAYGPLYQENTDPSSHGIAKIARMKTQMDRMPPEHHAIIRDYMAQGDIGISGIHLGNLPIAKVPDVGADYVGIISKDGRALAGPDRVTAGFWSPARRHVIMDTGSVHDGSYALAAHELGHALDQAYGVKRTGTTVSATSLPDFQNIYKLLTKNIDGTQRKMNPYYTGAISNGPKEVYAEGYSVWSQRRATKIGNEKWNDDDVKVMAHQFGMDPQEYRSRVAISALLKYFDRQHQNILADTYGADNVQHLPKETTR